MKFFFSLMIVVSLAFLAGCSNLGYHNMTPEQIRATAGTSTCTQYSGLYGKASMIALNADDTKKGATSEGVTEITCGDAVMKLQSKVGVPVPVGATTTTTTVVKPAQ